MIGFKAQKMFEIVSSAPANARAFVFVRIRIPDERFEFLQMLDTRRDLIVFFDNSGFETIVSAFVLAIDINCFK